MNWKPWFVLLSACCGIAGCAVLQADASTEPSVVYRHRFIGAEFVADFPVKPKADAILSSTNAVAFRRAVENRFATWVAHSLGKPAAGGNHLEAAMDLLLLADSCVEVRQGDGSWSALFAAHLAADEGDTFIKEVSAAAKDLGLDGSKAGMHLVAKREGEWVVAAAGSGAAPAESTIKARMPALTAASPAPKGWPAEIKPLVSVEADLPALSKLFGWPESPVKLGRLALDIGAQGEFLKTSGSIGFPSDLVWPKTAWNVPTNLVRDPLVSFTAIRALGPLLGKNGLLPSFVGDGLANSQAYLWTVSEVPFQTHFAIASATPGKELDRIAGAIPPRLNPLLAATGIEKMGWNSAKTALEIPGLSLVVPQIAATNDSTGSWLNGGLLAPLPHRGLSPVPEQLLGQFNQRGDIVAYDWELTQERVGYWRALSQLLPALGQGTTLQERAAIRATHKTTEQFLQEISPQLGNTITEVSVDGPRALAISRKSHLGLSGFEIVHLARWLADSPARIPATRGAATPPPSAPAHP